MIIPAFGILLWNFGVVGDVTEALLHCDLKAGQCEKSRGKCATAGKYEEDNGHRILNQVYVANIQEETV